MKKEKKVICDICGRKHNDGIENERTKKNICFDCAMAITMTMIDGIRSPKDVKEKPAKKVTTEKKKTTKKEVVKKVVAKKVSKKK